MRTAEQIIEVFKAKFKFNTYLLLADAVDDYLWSKDHDKKDGMDNALKRMRLFRNDLMDSPK